MSFIDTKEIKHSLPDGFFKTMGLMGVGYLMGGSKPTLNPNFKNIATITATIASMDVVYDYGKKNKWWPWL